MSEITALTFSAFGSNAASKSLFKGIAGVGALP